MINDLDKLPLHSRKISQNLVDILTNATDASFYRYVPEAVIKPETEQDIQSLFLWCKTFNKYITFRAAGTSLSGQALTDGVLIDLKNGWNKFEINKSIDFATSDCGVIAGKINEKLKKFGKKIGPDPASINSCTIGGILANNSSGMSSGIERNPYHTIESLRFILPSGLVIDTSKHDSSYLKKFEPNLFNGLLDLRKKIVSNDELRNKIINKYKIKTTIGYSLNAFIDFDYPLDILEHLMIGSEGTLGFISQATLKLFEDYPVKLTGLLIFPSAREALRQVELLKETGPVALEFMDYFSLLSVESKLKEVYPNLSLAEDNSALLFEFASSSEEDSKQKLESIKHLLKDFYLVSKPLITDDDIQQSKLWSIRKGLLASLGNTKESETTFILEDICFPLKSLQEAVPDLQKLFSKFEYYRTGVYGHGLDGNMHFMLTEDFKRPEAVNRLSSFMNALFDLVVVKYNGSLKAEHGTGRNMAPYVKKEWGEDAYEVMLQIKKLIDPHNFLNPGVIINEDDKIHLKNIKNYPKIESEADSCIECGFCESHCPSKNLTLTPRKRIVLQREIARSFNRIIPNELKKIYDYNEKDTCAVDGICSVYCPIGINTGNLVKILRQNDKSNFELKAVKYFARNFSQLEFFLRLGLRSLNFIPKLIGIEKLNNTLKYLNKIINLPLQEWNPYVNYPSPRIFTSPNKADFVYFTSCVSRIMGRYKSQNLSLAEAMIKLAEKSDLKLYLPEGCSDFCCGTIFHSKGFSEAGDTSVNKLIKQLYLWSDEGKLPIIIDSSSCSQNLKNCESHLEDSLLEQYKKLKIIDVVEFINDYVIDKLIIDKVKCVVPHYTCSTTRMDLNSKFHSILAKCSEEVFVPSETNCCGFAGDRGFLFPELTKSATKDEAQEVIEFSSENKVFGYYSTNPPCENAMSHSTGCNYESIVFLLLEVTR
ncbi:MAG: FAD-binding oxidoreductase [Candidatus Kapabacteria bacterium]|nr:FAD-binding oxidoreductase [Candidatus Kapabacteria bacterium]